MLKELAFNLILDIIDPRSTFGVVVHEKIRAWTVLCDKVSDPVRLLWLCVCEPRKLYAKWVFVGGMRRFVVIAHVAI